MKITETLKALSKALFLAILTVFAITTANAESNTTVQVNEKHNPVHIKAMTYKEAKAYESEMIILNGKIVPKTDEELRLCKHYSEKGKAYKEYNKHRTDDMFNATVRNCERRVKMYCGYLQEVRIEETKTAK